MTTTATTSKTVAVASGLAPIPFNFQALSEDEVGVTLNGAEQIGTFTVALNGDGTGSVTPLVDWGTGAVVIYSKPNFEQLASFERFAPFYPDQIVPPLDRLMRTIIAVENKKVDIPDNPAGMFLGFNALGEPIAVSGVTPSNFALGLSTALINILSSVSNTLFFRPSVNIANGALIYSATPDFATPRPLEILASQILLEPTDRVQINPTPLSYAKGIAIVQSTPASGSQVGPFFANSIDLTVRSTLTGTGLPGGASSATFGGMRVSVDAGGANFNAVSVMGGSFAVTQTVADTSGADKNGLSSGVSISASTSGKLYGGSSAWTVNSGGVCAAAVGYETDVTINGTGVVPYAIGFNAWKGGTGSGGIQDAAYAIGISGAVGTAKWKTGHLLYTMGGATASPVDAGFVMFGSDHATTIGDFLHYPNVTISGYILNTPNVLLSGAGALGLNTALASIGIGALAPTTTSLLIAPGTATKTQLRLVAGIAPTVGTPGDIWSDGTNIKWVNAAGVVKTITMT